MTQKKGMICVKPLGVSSDKETDGSKVKNSWIDVGMETKKKIERNVGDKNDNKRKM